MADMRTVDLGRTFDAVTCLFSSVGYLRDAGELASAIGRMAAHLAPGGVLVVDGWVRPDAWWPGTHVQALAETADGVAAARVARTWREGDRSVLDMRYLIATADDGFAQEQERHELTLFSDAEYRAGVRGRVARARGRALADAGPRPVRRHRALTVVARALRPA